MSKIALGTVQFGIDYGLTNLSGQVSIDEVRNILTFAKNNGIDTLDTASGYGISEQVLGRCGVNSYQIITKTVSLESSVDKVIDGFYKSLENLGQKQVEGLLVHDINNIENKKFDILFSKLNELKQQGLIKKIGFSTYTPEQINFLLANFDFDLIQVPFNVFDNRLIQSGHLQELNNKGIEVHARSIFLQGILLDFNNLSNYFSTWKEEFNIYQKVVKDSGLSLLEYALNFVLSTEGIDKALVGVNHTRQLEEIIQSVKRQSNLDAYPINDVNLLNPGLWKV
jgi:aryl-alcohol dehydrogenase-like predicted oxidoreductase